MSHRTKSGPAFYTNPDQNRTSMLKIGPQDNYVPCFTVKNNVESADLLTYNYKQAVADRGPRHRMPGALCW